MTDKNLIHTGSLLLAALALASAATALAGDLSPLARGPAYTAAGELRQPKGFREWVFIGAPLTPHALNGGEAGFPEFHNVYVQPEAFAQYRATGTWPEGTMMVKELQLTIPGETADGSRTEVSGRGYFPGEPNGLDVSVKDSARFGDTRGWGFFNFGHNAPPYAASAPVAPTDNCAGCHMASAHEDMVFRDFYRQLDPLPTAAAAGAE